MLIVRIYENHDYITRSFHNNNFIFFSFPCLQFLQLLFKLTEFFFLENGCFHVDGRSDSSTGVEFSRVYIQFLMNIKLLNSSHVHFNDHKEYVNAVLRHKLEPTSNSIIFLIHRRFNELRIGMIQHFQQVLLSNHASLRDSLYFFRAGEAHSPIKKHSEQEWTYFPVSMFNIPHLFGMVRVVSTDANDNM